MVEKLKEVSSVPTTDDYAVLVTVEVLPQTSELLFVLKEENTNAVLYKIGGAMDSSFADAQVLKAESLLAKNGSASKVLNDSWLWVRVLHKAAGPRSDSFAIDSTQFRGNIPTKKGFEVLLSKHIQFSLVFIPTKKIAS